MAMYDDVKGCNIEIMGFPFYAEKVSVTEAFRRRELNFNAVVGGTQKVTKGQYVGLEFKVTTHVKIDPDRPDEHNSIFQEMMSKPVTVVSPELGGKFKANVVIVPDHAKLNSLELSITIKEIPGSKSLIPGESWVVPKTKKIDLKKKDKKDTDKDIKKDTKKDSKSKSKTNSKSKSTTKNKSKKNEVTKKSKSR